MSDRSALFRFCQHLFHGVEGEPYWAGTHRRTVAPAVVRFAFLRHHPLVEIAAVASVGVCPGVLLDRRQVINPFYDCVSYRHAHDRVVGEGGTRAEQRKVAVFDRLPFKDGADDVASN